MRNPSPSDDLIFDPIAPASGPDNLASLISASSHAQDGLESPGPTPMNMEARIARKPRPVPRFPPIHTLSRLASFSSRLAGNNFLDSPSTASPPAGHACPVSRWMTIADGVGLVFVHTLLPRSCHSPLRAVDDDCRQCRQGRARRVAQVRHHSRRFAASPWQTAA